jgi:outer membrane protein OmpA-like peptidoglycan-associated protein
MNLISTAQKERVRLPRSRDALATPSFEGGALRETLIKRARALPVWTAIAARLKSLEPAHKEVESMSIIPSEVDEQAVHEEGSHHGRPNPNAHEHHERPVKTQGSAGVGLGVFALILICGLGVFGLWLFRSVRRLDRRMAQVSQQMERLNHRVGGTEQQSQTLAQQALQAAASAKAAAQQRDEAKQAEENSAAQAQSALQDAATAKQQATQAEQKATEAEKKAEEYRKQREEELQQLQTALGQIAETHRTAVGLVMTLGEKSIRFDFDKAEIKPQYRDLLNRIAGILMTLKQYSIYVYGYTDDVGTADYNMKLSARRAEAVRSALVQAGIKPGVMTAKGFGKSDPRVKGDTAKARAANRRVEIGIVDSRILMEPVSQK